MGPPVTKSFDSAKEVLYFLLAADHRRIKARNPAELAGGRTLAQDLIALYGLLLALHLHGAKLFDVEEGSDEPVGGVGDPYRARFSRLFHASGQIDGVAHCGIFDSEIRADLADYYQAGVDTDTNVEIHAPGLLNFLAVGRGAFNDVEGGQHGSLRVILVINRGAEEGKDRVAH